jgi:hypothetical protein
MCLYLTAIWLQATGMGKMLVFGGLTGSGRSYYIEDYFQGNLAGLTTLNDLW